MNRPHIIKNDIWSAPNDYECAAAAILLQQMRLADGDKLCDIALDQYSNISGQVVNRAAWGSPA